MDGEVIQRIPIGEDSELILVSYSDPLSSSSSCLPPSAVLEDLHSGGNDVLVSFKLHHFSGTLMIQRLQQGQGQGQGEVSLSHTANVDMKQNNEHDEREKNELKAMTSTPIRTNRKTQPIGTSQSVDEDGTDKEVQRGHTLVSNGMNREEPTDIAEEPPALFSSQVGTTELDAITEIASSDEWMLSSQDIPPSETVQRLDDALISSAADNRSDKSEPHVSGYPESHTTTTTTSIHKHLHQRDDFESLSYREPTSEYEDSVEEYPCEQATGDGVKFSTEAKQSVASDFSKVSHHGKAESPSTVCSEGEENRSSLGSSLGKGRDSATNSRRGRIGMSSFGALLPSPVSPGGGKKELFNRAVQIFSRSSTNRQTESQNLLHTPTPTGGQKGIDEASCAASVASQSEKTPMKPTPVSRHARGTSWGEVLRVYAVKKHVPALVRQKRIEDRRASISLLGDHASSTNLFPTRLHELCAEPDATLAELIECLETNPEAVSKQDHLGKLPLHILGDNESLISSPPGKQIASAFAFKLMETYPEAITTIDRQGHMPFVTLISDWVEWVYDSHRKLRKGKQAGSPAVFQIRLHTDNVKNSETRDTPRDTSNNFFARRNEDDSSTAKLFPKPDVWDEVEWCFSMLSLAQDELAGKSGVLFKVTKREVFANNRPTVAIKPKKPDSMRREMVCHLISVIPNLLKTVLLIDGEGGEAQKRILKMSVFRRMLLCHECIGNWLTQMIRKAGSASRRAVDFMELVSDTKVEDYTGGFRTTTIEDIRNFCDEQSEVFNAVNALEGAISSLVTMEKSQVERAAATKVIWYNMGERLKTPFVLGLVLVDLVLHIALMIAFRNNVQINVSRIGEISTQSVLFICSHYLIRKGCEALALLTISPSIFRGYFTNVWTLFDLMAIAMTMTAFVWNSKNPGEYRNGYNAFVIGLLWMKVVGFLKVVNKDMSTFILALLEILVDIRYFLVVLVVVIFMFGDMAHLAVSTKDNGRFCDNDDLAGPTLDFCNPELTPSYLRFYAILLGDFELNDLQDSTGITTFYVIFTSLGVVILLNVLIAVISDSYERATVSSAKLFGRARVTFVAQNEALEAFLKPGVNPMRVFENIMTPRTILSRCFTLFRWFVLLAIIATACDTALFLVLLSMSNLRGNGGRDPAFVTAILLFCLSLLLIAALGVLIGFAFKELIHRIFPGPISRAFDCTNYCCVTLVRWVAFRLFGLHSQKKINPDTTRPSDDWSGRLNYLESTFEKIVENAKKDLIGEITALETRLYEHEIANREAAERDKSGGLPSGPRLTFPMLRSKK